MLSNTVLPTYCNNFANKLEFTIKKKEISFLGNHLTLTLILKFVVNEIMYIKLTNTNKI